MVTIGLYYDEIKYFKLLFPANVRCVHWVEGRIELAYECKQLIKAGKGRHTSGSGTACRASIQWYQIPRGGTLDSRKPFV
jgi:hypothetical protein